MNAPKRDRVPELLTKEETIRTVMLMETEEYDTHNGGQLVESAVVEVPRSMFETVRGEDPADWDDWDWDQVTVIERCGHRHRHGSNACRQCNIRMGGSGW